METLTYKQASDRAFNSSLTINSPAAKDFLSIGSTPHDEFCTQAGASYEDMLKECTALKNQLIREKGPTPTGADFFIMKNHHDFGTYLELAIFYTEGTEEEDSKSQEYAAECELLPDTWDEEAIHELECAGYTPFQTKIIKLQA